MRDPRDERRQKVTLKGLADCYDMLKDVPDKARWGNINKQTNNTDSAYYLNEFYAENNLPFRKQLFEDLRNGILSQDNKDRENAQKGCELFNELYKADLLAKSLIDQVKSIISHETQEGLDKNTDLKKFLETTNPPEERVQSQGKLGAAAKQAYSGAAESYRHILQGRTDAQEDKPDPDSEPPSLS